MERGKAPCCESTAGECFNAESLAVVMTVSSLFSISLGAGPVTITPFCLLFLTLVIKHSTRFMSA